MRAPRVVTHNVVSVDGRLTIAPGVSLLAGDARWDAVAAGVGDPYAWVRRTHDPDVLLEGSGSFVPSPGVDGSAPPEAPGRGGSAADADDAFLPAAVVDVPGRRWFTVVDGRGRVDLRYAELSEPGWAGWHALVLTSRAAPGAHLARLRDQGIPYLVVGGPRVDLARALGVLARRLGVRTVVSTGGGRLGGALLRAGLVDEVDLEVLPAAIGGRGTPSLFDAPPLRPGEWPVRLDLISVEEPGGGRLRLRYAVRGPAGP
ncbi:dihydrofolate reductase family protein [Georgenia daeguensis]|uniref:Bacterial bifunctional deaminase-reductase C-terminal domain-containing protein n=1 Tax=Georgenia daeguensis TaxID=908355 RepID=A0ABP8EXF0_9MICO